ncbi:2374_t:CDS:2 [Dentiscutata erythropus]|uniref:2374_t:CDS:1 n=1 Tax=Dentiscutata erythropus TaxID=1348616 RepID=A0A9N9AUJ0_9GLOM|nr:2374_t:CDS:2 [Dentiscutata erythropus]
MNQGREDAVDGGDTADKDDAANDGAANDGTAIEDDDGET